MTYLLKAAPHITPHQLLLPPSCRTGSILVEVTGCFNLEAHPLLLGPYYSFYIKLHVLHTSNTKLFVRKLKTYSFSFATNISTI